MKINRDHLTVVHSETDSFGTLHVIVYNESNGARFSIYLDEGEHHLLSSELDLLAETSEAVSI